jgi:hypothetical protein
MSRVVTSNLKMEMQKSCLQCLLQAVVRRDQALAGTDMTQPQPILSFSNATSSAARDSQ